MNCTQQVSLELFVADRCIFQKKYFYFKNILINWVAHKYCIGEWYDTEKLL